MALFTRKTKEVKKTDTATSASTPVVQSITSAGDIAHVLKHARITEKATMHSGQGVYTFDVETSATKPQIGSAIRALYKVSPVKINIVTVPSKEKRNVRTGKSGVKGGGKKAYIYLKKGDTINL